MQIKNASAPRKYQAKEQALVNALSRAFAPRQKYASDSTLSLDTSDADAEVGRDWIPVSNDPIDVLIQEEQQRCAATHSRRELGKIRKALGADKWVLLMASLDKTNAEIAADINRNGGDVNASTIQRRVHRIRQALVSLDCLI